MLMTMRDDIKATKSLTEDVHLLALNMQNIQKSQEETNKKVEETLQKVDALSSKEFKEYEENKKIFKQNVIDKIVGGIIGAIITGIVFIVTLYFKF